MCIEMIEVNALKGKEVEGRVELDGGTEWCGCDCNKTGGQLCHQGIWRKLFLSNSWVKIDFLSKSWLSCKKGYLNEPINSFTSYPLKNTKNLKYNSTIK